LLNTIFAKVFGTKNEREVKRMQPLVQRMNGLEPAMQQLSDEQLRAKTEEFRQRIRQRLEAIEDEEERVREQKAALDELLPEAFAVVREAGRRVLNMRHFDVQLIGGMVLHQGKIAEMKTGEGKTLVATLPVYLNSLAGLGVHVVTVNDYLAKRDSEWMGQIYRFLGLSVGVIVHELDDDQRREAYAADVTYGTNNEFGFDYLRDNMKFDLRDCVQRGHHYGIVDEVDSILIDEARTPLIISGSSEESNIADPENWDLKHHVETAIKAHALYKRDVNYVVKDGEVLIVDEFTGRLMPGRRWSDGLHQAVEAKEGVKIERENQTLATVTFQNYFRMYKKLAGMTGTAETEAAEFYKIYKLEVVAIPTNRVLLRREYADIVFRTEREKFNALAEEIQKVHDEGRPALVGTVSIEKSERLSDLLKKKNVKHVVLNAKFHEKEAEIVAQAGRQGTVTIATNMAGRGTDILLGGNPEFLAKQECFKKGLAQPVQAAAGRIGEHLGEDHDKTTFYYQGSEYQVPSERWVEILERHREQTDAEHAEVVRLGGLHILGTERHEARRIDNQLRGRAGRQGDPGSSRFYLSLEDDLMRIFARDWVGPLLQRLGMEEGVPIESRMMSRRIAKAQEAVEGRNFEARKHLLEYDDVMNKQREAVYSLRRQLLEGAEQKELILDDYVADILAGLLDEYVPRDSHPDQWNLEGLKNRIFTSFGVDILAEGVEGRNLNRTELGDAVFEKLKLRYEAKEKLLGPEAMRHHERIIMLSVIDGQWKDHLLNMDHLREGIGLRGYGQHDPLVEYKRESFDMFEAMMQRFQEETVRYLYLMQVIEREAPASAEEVAAAEAETRRRRAATSVDDLEEEFQRKKKRELEEARMAGSGDYQPVQQVIRSGAKVGRNDPCPCGSGKKYKKCCGVAA
jgi:preprotein translocase subunit SecA